MTSASRLLVSRNASASPRSCASTLPAIMLIVSGWVNPKATPVVAAASPSVQKCLRNGVAPMLRVARIMAAMRTDRRSTLPATVPMSGRTTI